PFPCRKLQHVPRQPGVSQRRGDLPSVESVDVRVRDHHVARRGARVAYQGRQPRQEPAADQDVVGGVALLADGDADRHHGRSESPLTSFAGSGDASSAPIVNRSRCTSSSRSRANGRGSSARARPSAAFNSSTSPYAATRRSSLGTRPPPNSPVSPPSPVLV